jgi:hypothetical protein
MTETQERFLRTVLTRVPLDSVVELHLFPSLRRGTVETGVAVIATRPPAVPLAVVNDVDVDHADAVDGESVGLFANNFSDDDSPYADEATDDESDVIAEASTEDVAQAESSPRMRILTASYRSTVKGVERGAWVVDVQEEADAPLDAVEAVLRGVRHRSTEPADPELIGHDTLAALLAHSTIAPAA